MWLEDKSLAPPLIVCVSANPALDRRLRFRSLRLGDVMRAESVEAFAGGKAAHVALAAHALGTQAIWLGFLGGATGDEFISNMKTSGIDFIHVRTRKPTRMNLELLEKSGRITEMLEPGEPPTASELREMVLTLAKGLRRKWRHAFVVVSGSLPRGVPANFYAQLISAARSLGARVFLDASGEALHVGLAAEPEFVKPNLAEIEALLDRRLKTRKAIAAAARELVRRGAESAAISLGAEGLVWLERPDGPVWHARPPRLTGVSTVGNGDATVAGFVLAAARGLSGEAAVRLATACGAANTLAASPGRISVQDVKRLIPRVTVQKA